VFEIIFKNEFEFFKKIPYILIKKILEIQGYFYKITLADSQNQKTTTTTTTASSDELTSKEIFFLF
jgi:hypothetical protein